MSSLFSSRSITREEAHSAVDALSVDTFSSATSTPSPAYGLAGELEDGRLGSLLGESRRLRARVALESHTPVLPSEGGLVIFKGPVPPDWAAAPDGASLTVVGRDVVFPGEQLHILVHLAPVDPAVAELVRPERVTEHGDHNGGAEPEGSTLAWEAGGANPGPGSKQAVPDPPARNRNASVNREGHERRTKLLFESAQRSHYFVKITDPAASQAGLPQRAYAGPSPPAVRDSMGRERSPRVGQSEESSSGSFEFGCAPLMLEGPTFDPHTGGGLARCVAAKCSLSSGDVAVLLQLSIATDVLTSDAVLEVLQFESFDPVPLSDASSGSPLPSPLGSPHTLEASERGRPSPAMRHLQQWLLPLDRPPSGASPLSQPSSWTSSPAFSFTASTSASFSLSLPRFPGSPFSASPPESPLAGTRAVEVSGSQKEAASGFGFGFVGSEGLLSFRGASLEPQRFAAQCGLEGSHVPGRRWVRRVGVLQPLAVESYSAECNMQDLLCILVENILPWAGDTCDAVLHIDSITLESRARGGEGGPLPVHVAPAEAGDGMDLLPGLALRPGEQHSIILRPSSQAAAPPPRSSPGPLLHRRASTGSLASRPTPSAAEEYKERGEEEESEEVAGEAAEEWDYSAVIACRCSHTESPLYFRHPLTWRPRPPRDLLLSVTMEEPPSPPSSAPPRHFIPQTVTVRATNLTQHELSLTLLAPSSMAATALSRLSFPLTPAGSVSGGDELESPMSAATAALLPAAPSMGGRLKRQGSFSLEGGRRGEALPPLPPGPPPAFARSPSGTAGQVEAADRQEGAARSLSGRLAEEGEGEETPRPSAGTTKKMSRSTTFYANRSGPPALSRLISLPPVRRMESFLGMAGEGARLPSGAVAVGASPAELVVEQSPERSHLWLQSVVPIGRVPPHGTAEVQCELLPLTDGILTLDTLHIATKRRDMLYIPEKPLQVFTSVASSAYSQMQTPSQASAYSDFGVSVRPT